MTNDSKSRLNDLKYSLQELLARVLYASNPKAAIKSVDGMIEEVVAYETLASAFSVPILTNQ